MAIIHDTPVNIEGKMFKKTGSWFALSSFAFPGAEPSFFLQTLHGMSALAPDKNRLINIFITHNGEKVPFTLDARAAELTAVTEFGNVRFTFADNTKIIAEGDPGMGLSLEKTMVQHETVHPKKNGAWEAFFRLTCAVIFKGLCGSTFDFNDGIIPWEAEKLSAGDIAGRTHPAPDGTFTLVMEEFTYGGIVRSEYPSYAEAKASMQREWDEFIEKMPEFIEPFESKREECEYVLWSYLISPYGTSKHTMIQMFASNTASQWQMCQNAVALMDHTELAIDLLLGPISRQGESGQLPDMYDDAMCESLMVKPPMHGWAVLEIMKRRDLNVIPRDKLNELYEGMRKWADWFLDVRDDDSDGLPSLIHSDETGLDDCSLFVKNLVITTPDVAAYLVLLYEAVGKLAELLGKPAGEIQYAAQKSREVLSKLIELLWDGEKFTGIIPDTRERVFSKSIVHYMPLILGDRLPPEILSKLVDDLNAKFGSQWGIASEEFDSEFFSAFGWGRGCVLPPVMMYIVTGLWDTKYRETARKYAELYCKTLLETNFPFFVDSKTGNGMYWGCSWSYCAYTALAKLL